MHNARDPQMVKTYGPGDSFGELALLYDAPRAATIKVMRFSGTDGQP
jgi:CRP-like cAMP-binding protein